MTRRRTSAGLLCLVLVSAGCGSTVQQAGSDVGTAELGASLSASDPGAPLAGSTSGPGAATSTTGELAGPGAADASAYGSVASSPGAVAGSSAPVVSHPAIKPGAPVQIGYATEKDIGQISHAFGISGVDGGDIDAQLKAVVRDINAHGGLAGHRIVVVEHDISTQDRINNPGGTAQAACADWTQDHHVFAVIDSYVTVALMPGMLDCLAKAGVPLISDWPTDDAHDAAYTKYPLFASPSSMTVDRYVPAEVDRLWANDFFTGWNTATGRPGPAPVKIGVQSFDDPAGRHYVAVLRAALARHGLKLDAVESHERGPSSAAAGSSAAVLKFRSEDITHVFYANVLFYKDAQSQGYHPRYAVDDLIGPALLAQNVEASQLHGAMGAGYHPLSEVLDAPNPSSASARCLAVMRSAGQVPHGNLEKASMFQMCSHWYLLPRIFAKAPSLTVSAFRPGLEALRSSYVTAPTYGTAFGPTRHFGAALLRDYAYVDDCGCFKFTSPALHRAP